MSAHQTKPKTVDEYIAGYPPDVQAILEKVRKTIREAAPEAKESISYEIPTYGNVISFGAWKKHIGLYPAPSGDEDFNRELAAYRTEKSTVSIPLDKPIPYDLIKKIVKYRLLDNIKRAKEKAELQ